MYFKSKKVSFFILLLTAIACSRIMFAFFDDPEGPNLLIVTVLALFVFFISLAIYLLKISITSIKRLLLAILIQIIIVAGLYFWGSKTTQKVEVNEEQPNITLTSGRQCYIYSHEGNVAEPYTVNEFLDLTLNFGKVTGTKTGTQEGPDMTNGYTGTITGTYTSDSIDDVFAYTIEGSQNKEQEIYRTGKVGIEKLRYQLKEEKGILVPDTTKEPTVLTYARVSCEGSN